MNTVVSVVIYKQQSLHLIDIKQMCNKNISLFLALVQAPDNTETVNNVVGNNPPPQAAAPNAPTTLLTVSVLSGA